MDENNEKNFNINSEDAKKEAEQTVKDVKETIKNVNLKDDTKVAKGFFKDFFKNPIGQLQKVSADTKNGFLKTAILILIVWLIAILLKSIFVVAERYLFGYLGSFSYFFSHIFVNILSTIKSLIAPIINILVISVLIYSFQKKKNKSFLTIASTVLVAKIPFVISAIVSLLSIIDTQVSKLTSAFSTYCGILSTVLLYFAIKYLSADEEGNSTFFWKFALIMGLFYIVRFVFTFLRIYL